MSPPVAALRILWQSFSYRVRMREANNLAVSVSMMVAFRLPWCDLIYRCLYALLLNVYVYLINDWCDIEVDLGSATKDREKTRFLAEHRFAGLGALVALGVVLLVGALLHSWLLIVAFASNTVIITLYSAWLKRVPIIDLVMMALAGATMTIVGLPENQPLGWKLLGFLSMICACYEVIQVIRDEPMDREKNVKTTAVLLGTRTASWIFRLIMAGAAMYGFVTLGSAVTLALLAAILLPLSTEKASRSWDLARIIAGTVWLILMAQIFLGYL